MSFVIIETFKKIIFLTILRKCLGPRTEEDSCLERMGESGNKGCNNWTRIEYYRLLIHIKTFTKMTLDTCMHVMLCYLRNFQCKWVLW